MSSSRPSSAQHFDQIWQAFGQVWRGFRRISVEFIHVRFGFGQIGAELDQHRTKIRPNVPRGRPNSGVNTGKASSPESRTLDGEGSLGHKPAHVTSCAVYPLVWSIIVPEASSRDEARRAEFRQVARPLWLASDLPEGVLASSSTRSHGSPRASGDRSAAHVGGNFLLK